MARAEAAKIIENDAGIGEFAQNGHASKSNAAGPSRQRRRSTPESQILTVDSANGEATDPMVEKAGGDLAEIETLFALYASAGRTINLWDWLQGFEDSVARTKDSERTENEVKEKTGDSAVTDGSASKRRRLANGHSPDGAHGDSGALTEADHDDEIDHGSGVNGDDGRQGMSGGADEHEKESDHELDENEQDRLHSTFIRFCEEARMMGLLRARGWTVRRGADEVIKGVGFV